MKKITILLVLAFSLATAKAQTLFTYGKYTADAKDFLKAYSKNKTGAEKDRNAAIRKYLDLYINSKLKIQEAYDMKLDTMPNFREELKNLRNQIIEGYLTDPESLDKLIKEAYERDKKDINVSHIFIAFKQGNSMQGSSDPALAKINEAWKLLQKGESFEKVAENYSEDPSVVQNKGNIGYITTFSLPYEFENIVYSLAPGKYSAPFKSKAGYHIFKNNGERKSVGRIRAAQLLLAFPPGADETLKNKMHKLADSLYTVLQNGGDFGELAKKFSNDYITAPAGGQMAEFGPGTYDPAFEQAAFGLKSDGDISAPVLTAYGYHLIKRISLSDVPASLKENSAYADNLKYRVQNDGRIESAKDLLANRVMKTAGYKEENYNKTDLWLYTDSLLGSKLSGKPLTVHSETPLFRLGNKEYTALDWIGYAQTNRYKRDGSGMKPNETVMEEFKKFVAMEYYRDNLENFNADFRSQMEEFKDGNLFFEIMMQKIWTPAQTDSAGQQAFYDQHQKNYTWGQSAGAVIFYCGDAKTAEEAQAAIAKTPGDWEEIIKKYGDKITAESGRFEFSQVPKAANEAIRPGMVTSVEKNDADESASFAYIKKVFPPNEQKSFAEAKGSVINDFQNELDEKWIAALKKKYPVKVNEKVLNQTISQVK